MKERVLADRVVAKVLLITIGRNTDLLVVEEHFEELEE